jgi:hypothetical protein
MMNSSLFVRDINVEGMFSSQRQTDPLEPHYEYDARQLAPKDLMSARPRPRTKESACLRTSDIEGAKPFSWNDIWAKQGDAPMRVTNYISDIDGTKPGQVAGRSNPHPELPAEVTLPTLHLMQRGLGSLFSGLGCSARHASEMASIHTATYNRK